MLHENFIIVNEVINIRDLFIFVKLVNLNPFTWGFENITGLYST